MTDLIKEEVNDVVGTLEISTEVKKEELAVVEDPFESIFITEKNTFDVEVSFYKEGDRIIVDGDENFDESKVKGKFAVTLKYPSQGDYTLIQTIAASKKSAGDDFTISDLMALQFARLNILIRKWTLAKPCTQEAISNLDIQISKAVLNKISEKIGMDGML
jgi:hypothetical protein